MHSRWNTKIFGTQVSITGVDRNPDIFYTHLEGVKLVAGDKVKVGDYIGYWIKESEIRYYNVIDAGTPDYDNKHTYGGYKSFYYSYTATPVSINEFNGL